MVFNKDEGLPEHFSNSNVYMTVIPGKLSIGLNEQEIHEYEAGTLLKIPSLREMTAYGVKGMAAYAEHAKNIGKEDLAINTFIYEALAATLDDFLTADDMVALTLKTGEYGVKVMALLDGANTSRFGNPEITESKRLRAAAQSAGSNLKNIMILRPV